jgi:hypothetical protein
MKYINQRHRCSCGPTAIFNALVFCGKRVTIKHHYRKLLRVCKCGPYYSKIQGTAYYQMHKILRKYLRVRKVLNPTFSSTVKHLRTGNAVLLAFKGYNPEKSEYYGHYITIVKATRKFFWVTNRYTDGKPVERITINQLRYMLSKISYSAKKNTVSWFIYK